MDTQSPWHHRVPPDSPILNIGTIGEYLTAMDELVLPMPETNALIIRRRSRDRAKEMAQSILRLVDVGMDPVLHMRLLCQILLQIFLMIVRIRLVCIHFKL